MSNQEETTARSSSLSKQLKIGGTILILLSSLLFVLIFKDIFWAKVDYAVSPGVDDKEVVLEIPKEDKEEEKIVVVDKQFGLYIPKIKANAKVIKNVNPYNFNEYYAALEKGVAHAITSGTPASGGNTFLFAHSAVDFYKLRKLNVYFYLINKLKKEDIIYVSFENKIYKYEVVETKIVDKSEVAYLYESSGKDSLTLMTCWPAGTDWKRVIVTAAMVKE